MHYCKGEKSSAGCLEDFIFIFIPLYNFFFVFRLGILFFQCVNFFLYFCRKLLFLSSFIEVFISSSFSSSFFINAFFFFLSFPYLSLSRMIRIDLKENKRL